MIDGVLAEGGSQFPAARVVITDETKSGVVMQQRGTTGINWSMTYRATGGKGQWVFTRSTTDAANPTTVEVRSPLDTGWQDTYTVVQGTYNGRTGTMRLYVNGATYEAQNTGAATDAVPEATFTHPWQGQGTLSFGSGTDQGSSAPLLGEIDDAVLQVGYTDPDTALALSGACDTGSCS